MVEYSSAQYNSWKLEHFVLPWQTFLHTHTTMETSSHCVSFPVLPDLHWFIWTKFKLWSIIFLAKFFSRHMSRRYLWSTISFIDVNTSNNFLQIIDTNRSNQDCQQCYHSTHSTAKQSIQRILPPSSIFLAGHFAILSQNIYFII